MSDITVCPYENFPKLECVQRKCEECGVNKGLKDVITLLQDQISKDIHIVEWGKWKSMKITNKKTTEIQSKKVFVKHSSLLSELEQELQKQIEELSNHLFEARWQYTQFTKLKENLPDKVLVMVLNFAENYSTKHQDELQSVHWAPNQITIHPIVCNYQDKCHEMVFMSDDQKHDSYFVDHCITKATDQLKETYGVKFENIIQFTDGCSSQYKSKVLFFHISNYPNTETLLWIWPWKGAFICLQWCCQSISD